MLKMNINLKMDKETGMKVVKTTWRITKTIGLEGVKAILGKAALKAINTTLEEGPGAIGKVDLDYFIGEEKPKEDKPKRKWFGKKEIKDEVEEVLEEVLELEEAVDWKNVDDVTVEDIKRKAEKAKGNK
jgi:hypothetical protein